MGPERLPYKTGYCDVGGGHKLAYARFGNPAGDPVVWLHGGPGGGTSGDEQRFFDPQRHNLLVFDQRGAGASTPYAEIAGNTMEALIGDIETLREMCGVEKWSVVGGSFGSALAMSYAAKHPTRINRLLLRGVFFADTAGARHIIDADGAAKTQRNEWFDVYEALVPPAERAQGLTMPYYNRLVRGTEKEMKEAALLFDLWDTSIATPTPRRDWLSMEEGSLALARLFFYYTVHEFKDENRAALLRAMAALDAPVTIIHGRQDHICPVENAYALHAVCKKSTLHVIEDAGHAMGDPKIAEAIKKAVAGWSGDNALMPRGRHDPAASPGLK